MKKRFFSIIALVLTLSLVSVLGINIAAAVIETPIIPVLPTVSTEVRLTSDAEETVHGGTTVSFITEVNEVPKKGISSVELVYSFSDSLEFNGNITTSGIPSGWEISEYEIKNNKLIFDVTDVTGENAVKRSFAVRFSFDVSTTPSSDLYVELYSVDLKDADGKALYDVEVFPDRVEFEADSVVPLFEHIGASLRINNTPALRFGMRVERDEAYKAAMGDKKYSYSDDDTLKFGMLYIEENALVGDLVAGKKGVHTEIFKEAYSDNANEIVFTYTVENFLGNATNFVTRPFVIYEGDDGEPIYFYGEAKVRSASQVAEAELESTTDANKKKLLNKFIVK